MTVTKETIEHMRKAAINFLSTVIPILLAILGYALVGETQEGSNA